MSHPRAAQDVEFEFMYVCTYSGETRRRGFSGGPASTPHHGGTGPAGALSAAWVALCI